MNEAVLVTGLAYLALEATRYTRRIAELARSHLGNLQSTTPGTVLAQLHRTDYWRRLSLYATLDGQSLDGTPATRIQEGIAVFDDRLARWSYRNIFSTRIDQVLVVVICFLTASFLLVASYFDIACLPSSACPYPDWDRWLRGFFSKTFVLGTIVLFALAGIVPPLLVYLGRDFTKIAEQEILRQASGLNGMKTQVDDDPAEPTDDSGQGPRPPPGPKGSPRQTDGSDPKRTAQLIGDRNSALDEVRATREQVRRVSRQRRSKAEDGKDSQQG